MGGQGGMPGMGGMGGGMMGMPAAPTIQIVPNGQSRSVNGVSTQGYQVLVDGEIASVIWAAPVGSVSGAADLAEGFAGMQGFLAEMPFVGDSAAMYDINAMDGKIPLQTENYENGMVTSITTIGQGQSATFTEADFMPDASYAEQSMFDGFR